jgi:hypothetical protein
MPLVGLFFGFQMREIPKLETFSVRFLDLLLDLLVFFVSHLDSDRVPTFHRYLQQESEKFGILLYYYFVDYSSENTTSIPNLAVPISYSRMAELSKYRQNFQRFLLAKYFFVFNYVIEETTARWIFRAADDTMINFAKLRQYIAKLNRHFDPLHDIVIRGHCITRNGISYHQGGAGVLYSRRAVELLAPLGNETLAGQTMWEDAQFGWKLGNIGINVAKNTWSAAFVGTPFRKMSTYALESGNFRRLGPCPKKESIPFLAPANEIVFMHTSAVKLFEDRYRASMTLFHAPEYVYWSSGWGIAPFLCCNNQTMQSGWGKDDNIF